MKPVLATSREVLDDLRPLKPYEIPDFPWAAVASVSLVCVLLAAGVWRRLARRRPERSPVVWTQAMPGAGRTIRGRLEALFHAPRQTHAQVLQLCEQLGDIVRDLARQRHGIPGRRLTTSEFMERLEEQGVPGPECQAYRTVLETCDRVKFSGERCSSEVLSDRLTLVRRLLDAPGSVEGPA